MLYKRKNRHPTTSLKKIVQRHEKIFMGGCTRYISRFDVFSFSNGLYFSCLIIFYFIKMRKNMLSRKNSIFLDGVGTG